MSVSLCPTFGVGYQAFTVGGLPLNAGLIYTYIAGGTTPQATYTTSVGNVQNQNPIVLGLDGRPPSEVWLTDGAFYRFDVTDSLGNLIKTYDNISGIVAFAALAASSGSSLIGYESAKTGAVATTVEKKLQQTVSVFDFMTVAEQADVTANGFAVDVTAAVQAALNATNTGGAVFFPAGTYKITSTLTVSAGHTLIGVSRGVYATITGSVLRGNSSSLKLMQLNHGAQGVRIENLMFWGSSTTYLASTVAILMEGSSAAADADINGVTIVNCSFWRWEKAIHARDTAVGSYQVSSVSIRDCKIGESLYGVYLDSQNADFWTLDNCTGSCAVNGSCIYINKAGPLFVRSSTYSGADSTTTAMLTINGPSEPVLLDACQAESIKYFLNITASAVGAQVLMRGCDINGDIADAVASSIYLQMCSVTNPVGLSADGRMVDVLSKWTGSGALTLASSSLLVADIASSKSGSTDQLVARMESGFSTKRVPKGLASTVAIDARLGTLFSIAAANNSIFTIGNPTVEANSTPRITIQVQNTSGGAMGVITWDTKYKMSAWTNPANGFSRSVDFAYDGTNWIQVSQAGVDVPN